ncbi:TMA16-like protein [Fusarium tjaetaba]|uniref:TMA16-like protein n=1 Tax=Fusarium tjaetaba TaxID=1567544 RepID=A0A8H5SGC2_9HYPO|nr:TMA16-like protein [Fusarium tjaetaba]KAF5650513.1 TMA16-like protein [Fusarium tjaetaba]
MPTTLHKTRKQISKKRNGVVNALHEKSRDSMRLHKAGVRDQRIEKLAAARSKKEQPLVDRVAFFQQALRLKDRDNKGIPSFVHQYDEEYNEAKKARRPGRPASVKEDILKAKINILEEEYKSGFVIPDLLDNVNVNALHLWEGSWSYLTQLKWVKVNSEGQVRPTSFPSGGTN